MFRTPARSLRSPRAGSADLWRKISMYVCLPGSIVLGVYIYQIEAAQ
jgi:cytochrome c oxidase subunit 6a